MADFLGSRWSTPALNQAPYVEATLTSVLDGSSSPTEYVVARRGIQRRHRRDDRALHGRLTSWASQPDQGQYDAIARGFEQTTGDVMAWLNAATSSAMGLQLAGELFARFPQIEWLTTQRPLVLDERGIAVQSE